MLSYFQLKRLFYTGILNRNQSLVISEIWSLKNMHRYSNCAKTWKIIQMFCLRSYMFDRVQNMPLRASLKTISNLAFESIGCRKVNMKTKEEKWSMLLIFGSNIFSHKLQIYYNGTKSRPKHIPWPQWINDKKGNYTLGEFLRCFISMRPFKWK